MVKRLTVILVVCLFVMFVFAGGAWSAASKKTSEWRHISSDAPASESQVPRISKYSTPVWHKADCFAIDPEAGTVIDHQHYGDTWYDFQKNGSLGRMISVTGDGHVHGSYMWTAAEYPGTGRDVHAQCAAAGTPHSFWAKPGYSATSPDVASGYSNQTHLHDGTGVIIYHEAGLGGDNSSLTIDDGVCAGLWARHWSVPDRIFGVNNPDFDAMWPKGEVQTVVEGDDTTDYIQYVMTEGNTAGGVPVLVGYVRLHVSPTNTDTLVCEACVGEPAVRTTYYVNTDEANTYQINHFDTSCSITPVVAVSPVSKRMAIAYLHPSCDGSCDYLSDIYCIESTNYGEDWLSDCANWPPTPRKIVEYGCNGTERGFSDLNACYDYGDSLHVVFVTSGFDPARPGYYQPGVARLYHWSSEHGVSWITDNIVTGVSCGGHNLAIAKMAISAKDPIYHGEDSLYLFCTWTQFNPGNLSAAEYTSGDIYGSGSFTGGEYWDKAYNLTNTNTDNVVPEDCEPGECLSEHWSSMALNMYDGHLHLQYICDQDAGGAIQETQSQWMENPVMYLELDEWEVKGGPRGYYRIISPNHWYHPPIKVNPGQTELLEMELFSAGTDPLHYDVDDDHFCISGGGEGDIQPRESVPVTFVLDGTGACSDTFIAGHILLETNEEYPPGTFDTLLVHAVVAEDYQACPTDPVTYDTLRNDRLKVYVNSACEEKVIFTGQFGVDEFDSTYEVFFEGGTIVATTKDGGTDTLVGRFMYNDWRAGAKEKLYTKTCEPDFEPAFHTAWTSGAYMHATHLKPPEHFDWWWLEVDKQIKIFTEDAPDSMQRFVIKYVTVRWNMPPSWWPNAPTVFPGFEDVYVGVAEDIDCPAPDNIFGQSARNKGGYDPTNHIAWQQGTDIDTLSSPGDTLVLLNSFFAGVALGVGKDGESEIPFGTYSVRNDSFLYPQGGWGWDESELYQLAMNNTEGEIQDPDSLADRALVFTAKKVDGVTAPPNPPHLLATFTIIKAFGDSSLYPAVPGMDNLVATVARARNVIAMEKDHDIPMGPCGDVTRNLVVDIGDVVYILNYLFKLGTPAWEDIICPQADGDVNHDGVVDIGDCVYLLNYLFKLGSPVWKEPNCPGVGFYK